MLWVITLHDTVTDMAAHLQAEAQGIGRRRRTPHIRRTPLAWPAQERSHGTVMRRLRSRISTFLTER